MKTRILLAATIVAGALCAGYWWWQRPTSLGEADLLLLGDIANATGENNFDGTLREALRVALLQSPYLNLVSDEKIHSILREAGQRDGAELTEALLPAVCGKAGAQAYLTGKISRDGSGYVAKLTVDRCTGARRMAKAVAHAGRADLVVQHLGEAARTLRQDLGESPQLIVKYDVPLERATTPILASLRAYEEARRMIREKSDLEAVPLYKRAIDLDSRFAMAHSGLAVSYYNLNQMGKASDEVRQAYEAGDRQTYREHLNIATLYYDLAQGDIEKAIGGYKEYIRAYPRDDVAMGNLSSEYFVIGDYAAAAKFAEAALKIDPDSAAWYENYSTALLALSRPLEAEKVLQEAFSRKLDDPSLHANLYAVGFAKGDFALMQRELSWAAGKPNGEDSLLAAQSDTEAYFGRLQKAREYTRRAVESAKKAELPESAAVWEVEAAMREAMFGYPEEARKHVESALQLAPESKDVRALASLVFARLGEDSKAQKILDDLRALYVSNMVIQKAWLPVVQAEMKLRKKQYADAINSLEGVTPYEKGQLTGNLSDSCMIPAFLRGEAQLGAGNARQALAEFQKFSTDAGIVGSCWSAPLAKLGMARAEAMSGSTSRAKEAYAKFLEQWKSADPEIPALRQAKAEAAKFH
ncbi:MAG TPA: tetratricopeptide repeat protein [Candidatus Baltobacteraceae bacterium]|nr:tetratricopeptide repeat protein [Candidatus Baltobacteraceae bacterium]